MKKQHSATITGFFLFFAFFVVLENYLSILSEFRASTPIPTTSPDQKTLELKSTTKFDPVHYAPPSTEAVIQCDRTHHRYDICSINGPTVLNPNASTFHLLDPTAPPLVKKIRPYPRKWESFIMREVEEVTITSSGPIGPKCDVKHNVSALVFSAGGYTGNFWHDFNDGFIPLFITVNSIFPNQDFVIVVDKARDWWISKYKHLLKAFTKHAIVNMDKDKSTHCFTSVSLGLISHGFMSIDPNSIPNSANWAHFRALIDKAYTNPKLDNLRLNNPRITRPRLVLVSRIGNIGRVILNENDIRRVARQIGFDVIVFRPSVKTNLSEAYALINTSHAMIGVHGAALTHYLFLRVGAVLMQVVPIGNDWVADVCFGKSAEDMGLDYIEYKVGVNESSLVEKYDRNDLVIRDPVAYRGKNWTVMDIYLKEQNVRLDLVRFRKHLKMVYGKAKAFMDKEG